MTTRVPEEFRTGISLGQILEELISNCEAGKHKSDSDIPTLYRFELQLREDITALELRTMGLGTNTLQQIRKITPSFTYTEIGATLSYLRHALNGSHSTDIIQEQLTQIRIVKGQHDLKGAEYRLFLEYIRLFNSEKPLDQRAEEFKDVFLTVKDAFKNGHSKLARIIKEVDGSWDVFLNADPKDGDQYRFATQYKELERKYQIRISKVEELLEKYVKPDST